MSDFYRDNLLKDDLVAAPLAGYSFLPFRRILRKYFKGLIYSEMISVEGLARRNNETIEYLDRLESESPLVFQLFSGHSENYGEAVKVALDHAKIDAFDINMGCPVKKVLKAGGGCSLLGDLGRLEKVVKAMRKSTDLPFSIKIRMGLDLNSLVYKEILKIAENEGVNAITIHARTRKDMFSGVPRYHALEEMASIAKIPIIGNGNVVNYETYKLIKDTGVDGVMIGRGMMRAPWVPDVIRNKENDVYGHLSSAEIGELLLELWGYMQEHANARNFKETHYMHVLRKFSVWFSKGMRNATEFRVSLYDTTTNEDVINRIKEFFIDNDNSKEIIREATLI